MLIKPERIKPLTSFTRCTRYQWNFQKQDPGLLTMLPEWNNTIRTLAKLFPRAKWTPCLWMGRGALRIPNGPTDLASRGGQPYDE